MYAKFCFIPSILPAYQCKPLSWKSSNITIPVSSVPCHPQTSLCHSVHLVRGSSLCSALLIACRKHNFIVLIWSLRIQFLMTIDRETTGWRLSVQGSCGILAKSQDVNFRCPIKALAILEINIFDLGGHKCAGCQKFGGGCIIFRPLAYFWQIYKLHYGGEKVINLTSKRFLNLVLGYQQESCQCQIKTGMFIVHHVAGCPKPSGPATKKKKQLRALLNFLCTNCSNGNGRLTGHFLQYWYGNFSIVLTSAWSQQIEIIC